MLMLLIWGQIRLAESLEPFGERYIKRKTKRHVCILNNSIIVARR